MRILVIGAGVVGSIYAAYLQNAGNDVSILSRGRRLSVIKEKGISLKNIITSTSINTFPDPMEEIGKNEFFDLAIISVKKNQLASILPKLKNRQNIKSYLFMLNNAEGFLEVFQYIEKEKVLIGFPGTGGKVTNDSIEYALVPEQDTYIGEINGSLSPRLTSLKNLFISAGLKTKTCRNMDAWLKTHASFITAVAGVYYLSGGERKRLKNVGIPIMIKAVREGFRSLIKLGIPVLPLKLKILFLWVPTFITKSYWTNFLCSQRGETLFANHCFSAVDEIVVLADEFRSLTNNIIFTPYRNKLYSYTKNYARTKSLEKERAQAFSLMEGTKNIV